MNDRDKHEPPPGYLGSEARIRRGPAPEMVEAGYGLEIRDAPLLHRGLTLADLAHVVVSAEQGVIPHEDEVTLLGGLFDLAEIDAHDFPYDPVYGDAYNSRERWLEERIGAPAGWLAAGRPRREAGRIAFRVALRARVLDLSAAVVRFAGALVEVAAKHSAVVMPDYTYLQTAQPTTFGHYILSFAYPALRDAERLKDAYRWVNRSPGGAGGVAGSRFPIDRSRLAELLGFDGFVEHTRDAMWQTDGLVSLVSSASLCATNASRLAEDLEIYTSDEFGLMKIGDEFCRASALMPQKRNPYALAVIRGGAGTLIGRWTGMAATQRTPSARTDNLLYAYGEVSTAVEMTTELVDLAAAVAASLQPDHDALHEAAAGGFAQSTDLAEVITQAAQLDYRSAYRIVGHAIASAINEGRGPEALNAAAIDRAAVAVLGRHVVISAEKLAEALNPEASIATRTVSGGAAAAPMAAMVEQCRAAIGSVSAWIEERRHSLETRERALFEIARARRA
jgi:argininosuccinate lyase